ncbi:MAG: phosphatidylglycerol lysyltransferase domain-containing protein [Candidatus Omnitrophota bacterium]
MHIEPLVLEHRLLLDKRLKVIGIGLSDYSFANLYLFRQTHSHELIFDNNEIFMRGKTYDGFTYLMPTKHPWEIEADYLKNMLKNADFLFPVPEAWIDFFSDNHFQKTFLDADSDYIYPISKMVSYSGNKLHKKRNLLNQFIQSYEHQAYPLIPEQLNAAKEILEQWQEQSGQDKQSTDYYSCLEALNLSEDLVLCGMIYYVGKEPAGFVLGEELTSDVFDIKFAKAKKNYKGIYQYLYNDFAKLLPEKYVYFNFEEDLGSEALKLSKASYQPYEKKVKYRISLI